MVFPLLITRHDGGKAPAPSPPHPDARPLDAARGPAITQIVAGL